MTLNKPRDTQILNFTFFCASWLLSEDLFGYSVLCFYLGWDTGVDGSSSPNTVVLLNQQSNHYKCVTNSGLSSTALSMKSQCV